MKAQTRSTTGAAGRRTSPLLEERVRLVEAVLRGTLDAERARTIFAGLAADAALAGAGGRPP